MVALFRRGRWQKPCIQSEEGVVHTSTWQHVPSGDTKVVFWLWTFSLELPHLSLQHLPPRMMFDCPLGTSCVQEEPVFLCAHLLTARYPTGFLASVSLERWDVSGGGGGHLLVIAAGTLTLQAPLQQRLHFHACSCHICLQLKLSNQLEHQHKSVNASTAVFSCLCIMKQ